MSAWQINKYVPFSQSLECFAHFLIIKIIILVFRRRRDLLTLYSTKIMKVSHVWKLLLTILHLRNWLEYHFECSIQTEKYVDAKLENWTLKTLGSQFQCQYPQMLFEHRMNGEAYYVCLVVNESLNIMRIRSNRSTFSCFAERKREHHSKVSCFTNYFKCVLASFNRFHQIFANQIPGILERFDFSCVSMQIILHLCMTTDRK